MFGILTGGVKCARLLELSQQLHVKYACRIVLELKIVITQAIFNRLDVIIGNSFCCFSNDMLN